jgi:hypothetical protein
VTQSKRQPYIKWYARDWRGDGALRMCGFSARGLWADILSLIHDEGEPYGHLRINGAVPTSAQLGRMLGANGKEIERLLCELEAAGVFSRLADGTIYSRRMVRDKEKEEKDRANGKGGGNPQLKPGVNPQDNAHSRKPVPEPQPISASPEQGADATASEIARLNAILGFDANDYCTHAANIRTLLDLKAEGCDFDKHIRPAAERSMGKARSLAYCRPIARELRDAEKLVASMPISFEDCDESHWRDRLRAWHTTGSWPAKWGPKPGESDCRAPM